MRMGPQLRDIHLPPEPGWWPPAPVAAALVALLVLALAGLLVWLWRRFARQRRRRGLARFFDQHVASAGSEDARLQRASACLRRAVLRHSPGVVSTTGAAWLAVLDADDPTHPFTAGPGRLLAEGPFRGGLQPGEAEAAIALARMRFLQWGSSADA